jgi:conjugal transfer mating pair stabilization protein TraN
MRSKVVALLTLFFYLLAGPAGALAEYVCGQDLDGDGFADGPGETATCIPSETDWLCPVAAVDCETECPPGYAIDPGSGLCTTTPHCPQEETYDPGLDQCTSSTTTTYPASQVAITPQPATFNYGDNYLIYAGIRDSPNVLRWWSRKWRGTFDTTFSGGITFQITPGKSGGGIPVTRLIRKDPSTVEFYYWGSYEYCETVWVDGWTETLQCESQVYEWRVETLHVQGGTILLFDADGAEVNTLKMGNAGTGQLIRYIETGSNEIRFKGGYPWESNYLGKLVFDGGDPCPEGGTLSDGVCETTGSTATDPTCPEPGQLNPDTELCEAPNASICPLGDQYACLDNGDATLQCSPNTCFELNASGNDVYELPSEDPMLQNDGEVDADGNCLGEIYVFSGKAARCRPPGVTVGYANDCCESEEPALTDSTTGPRINQVVTAVQTVYEVAQVGYYAYQISAGAMAAVEVGGQVMVYNMATGSIAATYASGTATASGVMAAQGAVAAGTTGSGAVSAGITSYTGALLNPTTIAVAIVVMVVMKVLFGSGCDQRDIEAALLSESGYCVYLGKVCERKWPMVGCVQRSKRFCCFNSKMARIVHEQGRPQLKAFGPSGGWGSAKNPNCRGFTPEEFQQLDFSRIDLSEYFGEIQKELTEKIQEAQSSVQQKIEQHYQQIR